MKKQSQWIRVSSLVFVLLTFLTVPLLYQNCGDGPPGDHKKPDDPDKFEEIVFEEIEIRNGRGRQVSNGETLCFEADTDEESRSVVISIFTPSSAPSGTETVYCRRVRPDLDGSFWNCNEARSLSSESKGQFAKTYDENPIGEHRFFTIHDLRYQGLANGHYSLQIFAEGGTKSGHPWVSILQTVNFVVTNCMTGETCGDVDLAKSGSQPYPCPEGWSYKSSVNSLTGPPSRDKCCAPPATCSDTDPSTSGSQQYDCTGSSVYNKSAATKTNPSESVCCQGICEGYNCSQHNIPSFVYTLKNPLPTSGTNTKANCCDRSLKGTCGDVDLAKSGPQPYPCPEGWSYKSSSSQSKNPSRERCCTPPGTRTCSDADGDGRENWYDCRDLHGVNNNFSKGHLSASRENCCQGICEGYNCFQHNSPSWSYALKNPLPTSGKNNKSNCCNGSLKGTCGDVHLSKSGNQPYDCSKHGWIYKSSSSQSKNPSESVCCQCGPGYVGTPPDCRGCPPGQIGVQGRCVPIPRINPGVGGGGGSL